MAKLDERLNQMTPLQRAVFALRETQARLERLENQRTAPLAVIGIACRFPGGAHDPQSYWQLLRQGVDAIREIPSSRWDVDAYYDPDPSAPGKMNTRWGGFLERLDEFDNHFYGISDREAQQMDPQHRLLLELAWEVLEDAGVPPSGLRGSRTGVFIGLSHSEYGIMLSTDLAQTDAFVSSGTAHCIAANRISFAFDLRGPSMVLDTACSSSLVAVHLACQALRSGEAELALAGGVNVILSPLATVNLTKAGFSAPDGRVRAFDAAAAGYVRSEGAGLVVLKPLEAALRDGDSVYAVIRGSAVNQNGFTNGLTAPSRQAQERVLKEAYARAGISPGRVQYVETQGTGTPLGDAIEAAALGQVLSEGRSPGSPCAIGSVKTNLGHLEAASGVAGLAKVALALQHGELPPNLHFRTPNPQIPFDQLPLRVLQQLEAWPSSAGLRVAGVSAFGFGGSNAHVVLEEPPAVERGPLVTAEPAAGALLLPLSARTAAALQDLARLYIRFLRDDPPGWQDICCSAAQRRDHHDCRLAVLAASAGAAADALEGFLSGQPRLGVWAGRKPYGRELKIAFLYDGLGPQGLPPRSGWANFAPGFSEPLQEMDDLLQRTLGYSLSAVLEDDPSARDPVRSLPAAAALQLALAAWWRRVGVGPSMVAGCGVGELAAACAAHLLQPADALQIAAGWGRGNGAVSLTNVAGGGAVLPFLSARDGRPQQNWKPHGVDPQESAGSQGWGGVLAGLKERRADLYLEIAPRLSCEWAPVGAGLAHPLRSAPNSDRPREDGWLQVLGALYAAGLEVSWRQLQRPDARFVRLPNYPWQRQRHWAERKDWLSGQRDHTPAATPLAVSNTPATTDGSTPTPPAAPLRKRPELNTPYVPPRTTLEHTMARCWSDVLRLERVGIHDSFFELGGDSLQAAILLNRVAGEIGGVAALPLRDMFQMRTIAALAVRIEASVGDELSAADGPLVPISREELLPLSLNQEALWFLGRLEPGRPTYMLHLALNVRGPLKLPALERALNEIARRHEVLRTRFPEVQGQPVQVIAPAHDRHLDLVDLSHLPDGQREPEVRERIRREMSQPIDLELGPLIRITLLRRAEQDYAVVASTHHIIHDGWSMGLLLGELAALYAAFVQGRPSPLPELPIQYVDFAAWQRRRLAGQLGSDLRSYWRERLSEVPALELPADFARPAIRTTRGSSRPCRLSGETSQAVWEFCRREGVTPFMTLLAAFQVLLARHSGQDDFAIGAPVANRQRPETHALIGYFVNVVVLRADLREDPSFRQLVARVQQVALEAFERQELTLDQVVDAVKPARDPSRNPLFQVMFALQNIRLPEPPEVGLEIGPLDDSPAPPSANFDLTLELFERAEGFQGSLNFSTDLFRPDSIDRLVQQYQVLVAAAIAQPEREISALPLLDPSQHLAIARWNDTACSYDGARPVHELFQRCAAQRPEATAVLLGAQRGSYGELNAGANRLARHLQQLGVGPGVTVGVRLERSPELLVAVLGILKAGGAYVPLDPAHTRDARQRTEFIIGQAGISRVITTPELGAALDNRAVPLILLDADAIRCQSPADLAGATDPDQLAYIIYTSGSTGQPKGVRVTHGNLLNAFRGWERAYGLGPAPAAHLQMAAFGFDVFAGDMVRALCSGGSLVICPQEVLLDPPRLLELMRREGVEIAEFVPLVLRNLVQYLEDRRESLDFMRLVIVGSDAWYVADHQRTLRVLAPGARLINSYGLTEATIDSSYFEGEVSAGPARGLVPIGRPFANVRLYVLDSRRQPLPIGVPGELYIGGEGVAQGYVDSRLNEGRFLADPFADEPAARMFRTGDRARRRADGQVEFLGRADDQVKIRGFRVEPGEVEQMLRRHPALRQAAVAARQRTPGDWHLVAYCVGRGIAPPGADELRRYLGERLPDYMIPSVFLPLEALPMTASGKVDRQGLPAPDWNLAGVRRGFVAPATTTQRQLAKIWAEVLGLDRVGMRDSFFDLGGNSLLALRLVSRIRDEFAVELPLIALFASSDLSGLAERLVQLRSSGQRSDARPLRRRAAAGPVPLSFEQEAFWVVDRLFPNSTVHTLHAALPLQGTLNRQALQSTIDEIVRRHEPLRTTFEAGADGVPLQTVAPELTVPLPVEDLRDLTRPERDERIRRMSHAQAVEPFDLGQLPLFRLRLLLLAEQEYCLLITTHHMIFDGWSLQLLILEMSQLYAAFADGRPSPLPELPVQYADYVVWQRDRLQGSTLAQLRTYWRQKLAGLVSPELPLDRPWQAASKHTPHHHSFHISADQRSRLEDLARSADATSFICLLTVFKLLLQRYSGRPRIAVAVPVANRPCEATQRMLGLFVNAVVMQTDLGTDPSFQAALARVRQTAVEAYDHQEMPFELLADDLQPDREPTRFPLVQVMFNYHQRVTSERAAVLRELELDYLPTDLGPGVIRREMTLTIAEAEWGCEADIAYDSSLFEAATIERMATDFLDLLERVLTHPELPLSELLGGSRENVSRTPAIAVPAGQARGRALVPLQAKGSGTPLFCIHGLGGHVAAFLPLARGLKPLRPTYGLQAVGLDPGPPPQDSIQDMAALYVDEIRCVQPAGPYLLAGWSLGGVIAWETAQQLTSAGELVDLLALLDTYWELTEYHLGRADEASVLSWICPQLGLADDDWKGLPPDRLWERIGRQAERAQGPGVEEIRRLVAVCQAQLAAAARYRPQPYPAPVVLYQAAHGSHRGGSRWQRLCPQLRIVEVPGDHYSMLREPSVETLARRLGRDLLSAGTALTSAEPGSAPGPAVVQGEHAS